MSPPPARAEPWYRMKERGSALGFRLTCMVLRFLGYRAARLLLAPIALYYTIVSPEVRRHLGAFHQRAVGRRSFAMAFRTLRNFAESVMDRVFVLMRREGVLRLTVHHPEPVHRLFAEGRGALLLGAHLGPLEVSRIWPEGRKFRINVLIHSAISPMLYRELRRIAPDLEERMIPVSSDPVALALTVKERLDGGEFVAVLGDRAGLSGPTVRLPFLGAEAEFPLGPYALAAATSCPILLTFMVKTAWNHYDLFIEELDPDPVPEVRGATGPARVGHPNRREELERRARLFVHRLEEYCRRYPLQWYNFYDFWGTRDGGEAG